MRAIRANFDPYSQAKGRVAQLRAIEHTVDKVEYIVMVGTFLSLNKEDKDYLISLYYDTCLTQGDSCR
jgi:elongator complex protein 3